MGQYFKAVNVTKKEVVCPWCLGGVAKLIEWAINPWGAIFTLLLRKSDASGGGDFYGYRTMNIVLDEESAPETIMHAVAKGVAMEGRPVVPPKDSLVGRWAGDEVYLVGDYDSSKLFEKSKKFRNISCQLVATWNHFIDVDEMRLKYNPKCSCNQQEKEAIK